MSKCNPAAAPKYWWHWSHGDWLIQTSGSMGILTTSTTWHHCTHRMQHCLGQSITPSTTQGVNQVLVGKCPVEHVLQPMWNAPWSIPSRRHSTDHSQLTLASHTAAWQQQSRPWQWCWVQLQGRNNQFIRIVSMYQPCYATRPLTMYQQQSWYWNKLAVTMCPWHKYLMTCKRKYSNGKKKVIWSFLWQMSTMTSIMLISNSSAQQWP